MLQEFENKNNAYLNAIVYYNNLSCLNTCGSNIAKTRTRQS